MSADCPSNVSQLSQLVPVVDPMAFYAALWNDPSYGICVMDVVDGGADFRVAAFNEAIAQSLHHQSLTSVRPIPGQRLSEAFPATAASLFYQHLLQCVQSKQRIAFEACLPTADGDTWWSLSAYPVKNTATDIAQIIVSATDITAKKSAEAALATAQLIHQQVVDTLPAAIFWKDQKSRYAGCNRAFALTAGTEDVTKIIGKTDYDMPWQTAEADRFVQCDQAVMGGDRPNLDMIESLLQANGQQAWISISKIPLHNARSEVSGLVGIIEDITEQKETKENQTRLLAILEATPDLVSSADAAGNNLYLNRAGQQILGIPPEKITQFHISEVTSPTVSQMVITVALPIAAERGIWVGESEIRNRYGRDIAVSQAIICHKSAAGDIEYFSTIIRDISDRKAAEISLQATADRQAVLNQITTEIRNSLDLDTVIATTIKALHQGLKLDYCGFAWLNTHQSKLTWQVVNAFDTSLNGIDLGAHPADRLGPDISQLVNQTMTKVDDVRQCPNAEHQAFLNRLGIRSEILMPIPVETDQVGVIICYRLQPVERPVHRSSNESPNEWKAGEIELLQAVINQLAIAITQANLYTQSHCQSQALAQSLDQLRRTQAQIIQAEKMSSLGQMVAGVAHEINNPVGFIYSNLEPAQEYAQGLLELVDLYQQAYPDPNQAISHHIDTIDLDFIRADLPSLLNSMTVGTERIREIVLSLRNFSRLDEAATKTVDLHEGIDSTLVILSNRLKLTRSLKTIEVIKQYGDLPPVTCYPSQLNQVFMNILINAIDVLEDHRQPQIRVTTERMGDRAIIRIGDNGSGIPEEIQPRILDPFFTTKPVGKGTGMGMSISYQIITEKHGGQLSFTSQINQGTEFVIDLPLQAASHSSIAS